MVISAELARQRGAVADVESQVQQAAAVLIQSRNMIGAAPATPEGVVALEATRQRVALALEALDALKRAALVRP